MFCFTLCKLGQSWGMAQVIEPKFKPFQNLQKWRVAGGGWQGGGPNNVYTCK
jgi:hypothetical protein